MTLIRIADSTPGKNRVGRPAHGSGNPEKVQEDGFGLVGGLQYQKRIFRWEQILRSYPRLNSGLAIDFSNKGNLGQEWKNIRSITALF
jgi:hypothetical protein